MHLSSDIALDLVEERLPEDQKAFWHRHLELCKECAADVSRWRELEAALRRAHLKSPPRETVETAIKIISSKPVEDEPAVRSVLASIIFDSFMEPAATPWRRPVGPGRGRFPSSGAGAPEPIRQRDA